MLIHDPLALAEARSPDRIALVCDDERVTYAQLVIQVHVLVASLREHGTGHGDRVALFMDNGIAFVVGIYAAMAVGAIAVPIGSHTKSAKLAAVLADSGVAVLLADASLRLVWSDAVTVVDGLHSVFTRAGRDIPGFAASEDAGWTHLAVAGTRADAKSPSTSIIDQDLAVILYTSGSSGEPKGVMLTHLNMVSAARSVITYLGLHKSDVILCALSLAHGYGLYQVLMGIWVGATVVIEKSFAFPAKVLQTAEREHVTIIPGVPAMFARLTTFDGLEKYNLASLRILTNAAEGLPEQRIVAIRRLFPQAKLFSMYGQTECKRVTFLPPEELDRRPGSVGRGMPNQECWLIDADGQRLPHGSTGELVVRGSHVMRGYWGRPEETARRLRPGPIPGELVLHTGDLFRTDAEGWLYFVARGDDMIKTRGEKVSPAEVEAVVLSLPGVREAAVIGVPDAELGQAVRAFVVLEPGARHSAQEIIRYCHSRVEGYMVPRSVCFMDRLPRGASGKIVKSALV